ncbi:hypothetical protein WHR41_09081 [Cladosporium halotolerans]|uniref:Zn(2)-C6 fungal-type domain-containing protein n=1 Tax=Cladosporium halotolerans TaxID=1052096 RepID=A0AB34KAU0_9PEZI
MESPRPANNKRKRLSHACTRCRNRKVRCDESEPSCTNCVRAKARCETFDPRTQTAAVRREAQKQFAAVPTILQATTEIEESQNHAIDPQAGFPATTHYSNADESSPALWSPLLPVLPRFLNGNSLAVLTQWLDLAFARLGMSQRLYQTYNNVRSRDQQEERIIVGCDEAEVASLLSGHSPSPTALSGTLSSVLPFVPESLLSHGSYAHDSMPRRALVHALNLSARPVIDDTQSVERYFRYAFNNLPAIIASSDPIESLRALLLIVVYLRWHDDADKAWQILSLAGATVQNHSLHREHRDSPLGSAEVFWSFFVLDRVLATELERRPMLSSAECNRTFSPGAADDGGRLFKAVVDLAKLQDEILEKLQSSRKAEEDAADSTALQEVIKDKMRMVADLDTNLLRFADELPHPLKPTEYLYADVETLPGLTFLTVQYYQTVFLVSRNALLLNTEALKSEVDRNFGAQASNRLRSGINVCVNAARSILNVLNHAEETGVRSPLITPHAPLMAMYALTVHIVRRQSPATAKVDLELQATAVNLIRKYLSRQPSRDNSAAQEPRLVIMLEKLHKFSESYVLQSSPKNAPRSDQLRPETFPDTAMPSPQSPTSAARPTDAGTTSAGTGMPDDMNSGLGDMAPLQDLGDEWFSGMGLGTMSMDWDEVALALGLPSGQGWDGNFAG